MTAFAIEGINSTGQGKNQTSIVKGLMGRDEGTTRGAGFHDNHTKAHTCHDPVAHGEGLASSMTSKRKRSDQGTMLGNPMEQAHVLSGVEAIQTTPQHSQGSASRLHGALVGGSIHTPGPTADHTHLRSGHLNGKPPCRFQAIGRGAPRPHHRQAKMIAWLNRSLNVQYSRRIVYFSQCLGVICIFKGDPLTGMLLDPL